MSAPKVIHKDGLSLKKVAIEKIRENPALRCKSIKDRAKPNPPNAPRTRRVHMRVDPAANKIAVETRAVTDNREGPKAVVPMREKTQSPATHQIETECPTEI